MFLLVLSVGRIQTTDVVPPATSGTNLHHVVEDELVEVLAAQVRVAAHSTYSEVSAADGDDGHVKCAASQIVDQHCLLSGHPGLQTVRQRGGRGLWDHPQDVQSGQLPCGEEPAEF